MKGYFCTECKKYCHLCFDEAEDLLKNANVSSDCIEYIKDTKRAATRINTAAYTLDDVFEDYKGEMPEDAKLRTGEVMSLLQTTHYDLMNSVINMVKKYRTAICNGSCEFDDKL